MGQIFRNKILIKVYLLFLTGVLLLGMSACKSHKKTGKEDIPYTGETISVKSQKKKKETSSHSIGQKIADESLTWIGTPYGYGRNEKGTATDCSGMVIVIFEQIAEIKLPRNSALQANFCDELKEKDIKPGDLVFFATGKDKNLVSHVGIMIDKVKFVHASGSKGVIMSEMTTPYYKRTFIKYGRVPQLPKK